MPKVGFLPLYLKLYDDSPYDHRPRLELFYEKCAKKLEESGLEVIKNSFCRIASEFDSAVRNFKEEGACAVVTLHMAYSPSLECIGALKQSGLPVIILDTTETKDFGFYTEPAEVSYNHGIHGVMDMSNLLRRNEVPFVCCAGHWLDEGLFGRAAGYAKAASAARAFRGLRVGRIGNRFKGMGDFAVEDETLKKDFGIETIQFEGSRDNKFFNAIENQIDAERIRDSAVIKRGNVSAEVYGRSAATCIGVRNWIDEMKLDAFTFNFADIKRGSQPETVPFMEASKAMARGLGYAGEGDTLTACLVAALQKGFSEASFVEIFCPDWAGGLLYISHMGEMNLNLADPDTISCNEMVMGYSDSENPAVLAGRYKKGKALYVNLLPLAKGYGLVAAEVRMESVEDDSFPNDVRGWMRPNTGVADFLEKHSLAGATHHSALVYGASAEEMAFFGRLLDFEVSII